MKVMIAAGGTGGHIYPALALADVLKKEDDKNEVLFFGSSNRMESTLIPDHGYKFYGYEMVGTNGGFRAKMKSVISMMKAEKYALLILKEEKPDICVGFGNYISVPLIRAAHKLSIPTMLHEQNSFAGKANVYLARFADAIVGCYEANYKQFPSEKVKLLGNPEATIAADVEYSSEVISSIGLKENIPFVVFMMGSLGSSSVSQVIDRACPLFDKDYQVVIAAGKSNEYSFQYTSNDRIKIVPYVDGKAMLKGCSLAVVRAGATTMAEIGAIGCASVLIPSPYVPNNHQYFNAKELSDKDAAVLLEEKDLNEKVLADTVNNLMHDPNRIDAMKQKAFQEGQRDAAYSMIHWMKELINE